MTGVQLWVGVAVCASPGLTLLVLALGWAWSERGTSTDNGSYDKTPGQE